uniref:Uncharacterized protein n=1 Tax=Kwoniella dejecticola CBS 10117 TaxID=1296121 RepID=A0A1A5ZYW6_9TREE|nr:uncharacterized protein I303_06564 [Kwoniella dejecticola CBS 10117]OBR83006.1 hypothetical protein I303_06564 [Kwoniella dejecticola CBS 10117]
MSFSESGDIPLARLGGSDESTENLTQNAAPPGSRASAMSSTSTLVAADKPHQLEPKASLNKLHPSDLINPLGLKIGWKHTHELLTNPTRFTGPRQMEES